MWCYLAEELCWELERRFLTCSDGLGERERLSTYVFVGEGEACIGSVLEYAAMMGWL